MAAEAEQRNEPFKNGTTTLLMTLGASLMISILLMKITELPILLVAGFLPLLWRGGKS